jgi:hypothetical protein
MAGNNSRHAVQSKPFFWPELVFAEPSNEQVWCSRGSKSEWSHWRFSWSLGLRHVGDQDEPKIGSSFWDFYDSNNCNPHYFLVTKPQLRKCRRNDVTCSCSDVQDNAPKGSRIRRHLMESASDGATATKWGLFGIMFVWHIAAMFF